MKGNPAVPGGSLKSKPTWLNTLTCSTASDFFVAGREARSQWPAGTDMMENTESSMAKEIARAATTFEKRSTGRLPRTVTVVVSEHTLAITMHETFSRAETALAKSPAGAEKLREFHRQLFSSASQPLRHEIRRILGADVLYATAELETATGTVVQVFSLACAVLANTWSGSAQDLPEELNEGTTTAGA